MKKLELLIPPPIVMIIVGLLMWLVAIVVPELNFSWLKITLLASMFFIIGILIGILGIIDFRSAATTSDPIHPERASVLVISGIYAYTRNPMYLGVLLLLFGWAIYLGNFLSLIASLIFIIYINYFQIIPEERALESKFGSTYNTYKQRVRRWI